MDSHVPFRKWRSCEATHRSHRSVIQVSKACRGNTQGHHGGAMERGKKANDMFKHHQLISNVAFLRDISIIVINNFDLKQTWEHFLNI